MTRDEAVVLTKELESIKEQLEPIRNAALEARSMANQTIEELNKMVQSVTKRQIEILDSVSE